MKRKEKEILHIQEFELNSYNLSQKLPCHVFIILLPVLRKDERH